MPTNLNADSSITIDAPPTKVWEALTTPEIIKQWFFGVDTETDWKEGSPLIHRGEWQGKPYVDKGTIVKFEPPHRLVHTHWSDLSGLPDKPEHYQQVTWELRGHDAHTHLNLHEENIPNKEAQATSEESWAMVLGNLKNLLEK